MWHQSVVDRGHLQARAGAGHEHERSHFEEQDSCGSLWGSPGIGIDRRGGNLGLQCRPPRSSEPGFHCKVSRIMK